MSLLPIAGGTLNVSGTGGDSSDVAAYVCNMANGNHGEYTNFNFNSLANIGGVIYGCKSTGVFSLTGDTDNGTDIDAALLSGFLDFGENNGQMVNIDTIYLNARVYEEPISVRARNDEATDRLYPCKPTWTNEGMTSQKVILAKGLRGRNWQLGFENVNGCDFQVSEMNYRPNVLQRRI